MSNKNDVTVSEEIKIYINTTLCRAPALLLPVNYVRNERAASPPLTNIQFLII